MEDSNDLLDKFTKNYKSVAIWKETRFSYSSPWSQINYKDVHNNFLFSLFMKF